MREGDVVSPVGPLDGEVEQRVGGARVGEHVGARLGTRLGARLDVHEHEPVLGRVLAGALRDGRDGGGGAVRGARARHHVV